MTGQASPAAGTGAAQPTARLGADGARPDVQDRGQLVRRRPGRRSGVAARAEELIEVYVTTARVACEQMTPGALEVLRDSVERASCLPAGPRWERKAAAHAELFRLLAGVAGGRTAVQDGGQPRLILDLICTVGPAANGMITSSRRRLLAYLSAGDADSAALEMETHLRVLHYMWRLANRRGAGPGGDSQDPRRRQTGAA